MKHLRFAFFVAMAALVFIGLAVLWAGNLRGIAFLTMGVSGLLGQEMFRLNRPQWVAVCFLIYVVALAISIVSVVTS